jgi:hypothetical protein
MEEAFVHALQNPSTDLTGTGSKGGYVVGVQSEVDMAAYIKQHLGTKSHQVLTDNSQTYGVITLTGRPGVFIDRSQHGDTAWTRLRNDPYGKVRYMLEAQSSGADLIAHRYPTAAAGHNASLRPAFTTPRYVLLKVARTGPSAPASSFTPVSGFTSPRTTTSKGTATTTAKKVK